MTKTRRTEASENAKKLLSALDEAEDLVSLYAPLILLAEDRSVSDNQLMNAKVAVLYLMHKELVETITMPRSFQGLALPTVKAETLSKTLFENMGLRCCHSHIKVEELTKDGGIGEIDAQKLLPYLKQLGKKASAQVGPLRKAVNRET